MREILFRAKTLDDKPRWVEGYYSKTILYGAEGHEEHIPVISDEDYYWYKINPETLGEFTGIKDKNGVKVFEGDIVKHHPKGLKEPVMREVFWNKDTCSFRLTIPLWQCGRAFEGLEPIEVIGNIYDNPELLEEVK